jgi:hypothetical protein
MALTVTEPEGQESYPVYRHLDTVGDGTGSETGIADYSVTPRVLRVDCREGEVLIGHLLIAHIQDAGNYDPAKYGVLPALTTGIIVGIYDKSGVEIHRLTQEPVKDHGDWSHYGLSTTAEASAGDMLFISRIDLAGVTEDGLKLYPGQSIRATLNDNFTGLSEHGFIFHGGRRKR